jgi:hypothetical protein
MRASSPLSLRGLQIVHHVPPALTASLRCSQSRPALLSARGVARTVPSRAIMGHDDDASARLLAPELGGLAVDLRQAEAIVRKMSWSLERFRTKLANERQDGGLAHVASNLGSGRETGWRFESSRPHNARHCSLGSHTPTIVGLW